MQDNFKTYSLIESYLNGEMNKEESLAFEQEMSQNLELKTLVEDYKLVEDLVVQNELQQVNTKLSNIHARATRIKQLKVGLVVLLVVSFCVIGFIWNSKYNSISQEPKVKGVETIKSSVALYLKEDPTPFKIIDSMSEIELSKSIKESKENAIGISETEENTGIEEQRSKMKLDSFPISSIDSLPDKTTLNLPNQDLGSQDSGNVSNGDSVKDIKKPCELHLSLLDIEKTNTCKEKSTGSIVIKSKENNLLFSIDNKVNYSSSPYFSSLREGVYSVSVKDKLSQCESEEVEIIIKGKQCNYIIHPDRFIYLKKTLEEYSSEATVEVLVYNKTGNLVYNKTLLTSENFVWEGNSNLSQPLPMGNYTYMIKGGNKISKGEITIVR